MGMEGDTSVMGLERRENNGGALPAHVECCWSIDCRFNASKEMMSEAAKDQAVPNRWVGAEKGPCRNRQSVTVIEWCESNLQRCRTPFLVLKI